MGMEFPETAPRADDSYRAHLRYESVHTPTARRKAGFFMPAARTLGPDERRLHGTTPGTRPITTPKAPPMSALICLYIALGGALGSVGRAWLALLATRITGPQFPWGTIAINVIGSFIIGFFGTLTASTDGRFAVPPEARAFVMIGLCGGFTTFSSFSLQTLELARDGRMMQALANIGLSVALCLASVAIGHYGAAALNVGQVVEGAAHPQPDVAPAVIAVLDRPQAAPGILAAAQH